MSTITKKAILQAKVDGILTQLVVMSNAENIMLDDTTSLTAKIAEMVAAINLRAKSEDVTTEISTAISGLINGAPETYDTLKEIADYISTHSDVVDALNAAIGNKADKTELETVKATVEALGSLASKSKVSEADLDEALAEKVNAASEGNHSHLNKEVLDGIDATKVSEWDSKGTVFVSATEPADLADGDLWVQTIE